MKKLLVLLILSYAFSIQACDFFTGGLGGVSVSIAPGQTQTLTFNYSDCSTGIQNWQAQVTRPNLRELPPSTKLTADLFDLTTGEHVSIPVGGPYVLKLSSFSLCGHTINLVLTNVGNKALDVKVATYGANGGPCQ